MRWILADLDESVRNIGEFSFFVFAATTAAIFISWAYPIYVFSQRINTDFDALAQTLAGSSRKDKILKRQSTIQALEKRNLELERELGLDREAGH